MQLSFTSAADLRNRIEILPQVPAWKEIEVSVPGGTTKEPLKLLYRDGYECFSFLFGHPRYNGQMDFKPTKIWEDETRKSRLIDEIVTGDLVWNIQVRLILLQMAQSKDTLLKTRKDKV